MYDHTHTNVAGFVSQAEESESRSVTTSTVWPILGGGGGGGGGWYATPPTVTHTHTLSHTHTHSLSHTQSTLKMCP